MTMACEKFVGKQFKFDSNSSVNFDEYMKALGVDLIHRKLGNTLGHNIELLISGHEYTLKTTSMVKNYHITFKLGVEFDQTTADGRKVKATITAQGDTLTEIQTLPDKKTTTIVREFVGDEMICTMTFENIVSVRKYKVE